MKKNYLIILFLLLSISAYCIHNPCKNISDTSQVENTVLLFAETYGTARMDEAAAITTMKFRDGVPGSMWVDEGIETGLTEKLIRFFLWITGSGSPWEP